MQNRFFFACMDILVLLKVKTFIPQIKIKEPLKAKTFIPQITLPHILSMMVTLQI